HFNTMIAALMEYTNFLAGVRQSGTVTVPDWKQAVDSLILLLAPSAPHFTEELWQRTGHTYSIHNQRWPAWDEALAHEEEITLVVQINGKLRDRLTITASISEDEAKRLTLERPRVKTYLNNKKLVKMIYVPGRLINLVVK
ncbi:MAG: class I tRNA ligase family protein, partial [Chloroflexota bacterium]